MFDKMKQMKELTGLLANAGELQKRVQVAQDKLGELTTGGQAGANAVQVGINGIQEAHCGKPFLFWTNQQC